MSRRPSCSRPRMPMSATRLLRDRRIQQVAFYVACLLMVGVWLQRTWLIYQSTGLFEVIGIDWALFSAQALILRDGQPQAIYDLSQIQAHLQAFVPYTANPSDSLPVGPVPYLPLFAWLLVVFTLPPPPVGFALWTVLNLLALLYLAKRVTDVLPSLPRAQAALLLLVSIPVAGGFVVGQPTPLLACAMAECYLSLRSGHDYRAGLWLSLFLFKPQYGFLLGPLLLWKGRWRTVGGVATGAVVILGLSALLVGLSTLLQFTVALSDDAPFRGGPMTTPILMINWRAFLLYLNSDLSAEKGVAYTVLLGVATVAAIVPMWRGPWRARDDLFPEKMAALLAVTVLTTYHSQVHGATMLAVPLAAVLGQPRLSALVRWTVLALVLVPTFLLVGLQHTFIHMLLLRQPMDVLDWSPVVQVLFVGVIGAIAWDVWQRERQPPPASLPVGTRMASAAAEPSIAGQ